jgi:hypothetical protein
VRRTKLLILVGLAVAGATWWHRHTRSDRWSATDNVLPSLELPLPSAEPFVVPDPVADPSDLAGAPNRSHLTLLGNLPLEADHPSVEAPEPGGSAGQAVAEGEADGATVTAIGKRSGDPNH